MKNKTINYIMYGLIALVIILGIIFLTSGSNNEVEPTNTVVTEELIVTTNTINVSVGETSQIGVTTTGNGLVNYISTNPSIAKVDNNGIVEGISNGTAYIIVHYAVNNNNYNKQVIVNVSGGIEISNVSLPEGELLMKVNDTYTLPVTISPDTVDKSKLSYLVSDRSVVFVDSDGTVRALAPGIAAIRATAKENINADILVRVVDNPLVTSNIVIMPEKISAVRNITLKVDEEKDLTFIVEPTNAYMENTIWKSNNMDVVTVDNGRIKALSVGEAIITLKTINGMELGINVSVKPSVVEVSSLKLTSSENIELSIGETSQITYEIMPTDATDKRVSFQSNNTSLVNVNETGLITALSSGRATITGTSANQLMTFNVNVTVKSNGSNNGNNDNPSTPSNNNSCKDDTKVGTIDSTLLTSPTEDGFDKCKNRSRNLVPYINGTNYGQDGVYVLHVGETLKVNIKLPTMCGKIDTVTRTNHDGASGWSEYVSQSSSPKVNRNDKSTYVSGIDGYTWTITAKKKGCITLSQTAQFDVTSPGGRRGNMKSMIRLKIRIVD